MCNFVRALFSPSAKIYSLFMLVFISLICVMFSSSIHLLMRRPIKSQLVESLVDYYAQIFQRHRKFRRFFSDLIHCCSLEGKMATNFNHFYSIGASICTTFIGIALKKMSQSLAIQIGLEIFIWTKCDRNTTIDKFGSHFPCFVEENMCCVFQKFIGVVKRRPVKSLWENQTRMSPFDRNLHSHTWILYLYTPHLTGQVGNPE